jgi:hypothetical protein
LVPNSNYFDGLVKKFQNQISKIEFSQPVEGSAWFQAANSDPAWQYGRKTYSIFALG